MKEWESFLAEQERALGKETVNQWLRPLKVVNFDAGNLYLEAQDSFQIAWFEEQMRKVVLKKLISGSGKAIKVHLRTPDARLAKKGAKNRTEYLPEFKLTQDALDPTATFEDFLVGQNCELTFKFFQEVATGSAVSFNPIFLFGGSGAGKSHLLMACAQMLKKRGKSVFYVRAETFTAHVVSAIRNAAMQEFRSAYRHVDLLIIDDVHILSGRSATQEELFHTFNSLHSSGKQIILSANAPPQLLEGVEPRLISRFEWGIQLQLTKLSFDETKLWLKKRAGMLDLALDDEAIDFLVKTFQSHPKALEKAVQALAIRSHHAKQSLGSEQIYRNNMKNREFDKEGAVNLDQTKSAPKQVDLTKSIDAGGSKVTGCPTPSKTDSLCCFGIHILLKDLIEEEHRQGINPPKIIRAVADYFGMKVDDLLGKSQARDSAIPRQMAIYLCRTLLNMPYLKIGQAFSRDHSTIMASCKQVEGKLASQDKETCAAKFEILRRLS